MKKTEPAKTKKRPKERDELRPEYEFDYGKAKKNRFADRYQAGCRTVVLEPDVAAVFESSESVNSVLRSLINTMPSKA